MSRKLTIVVVDDSEQYRTDIVGALEKSSLPIESIDSFDPSALSFEEVIKRLENADVILLDNHFGKGCKFSGANIAPSFKHEVISISTDEQSYTPINFNAKTWIADREDLQELLFARILALLALSNGGPPLSALFGLLKPKS